MTALKGIAISVMMVGLLVVFGCRNPTAFDDEPTGVPVTGVSLDKASSTIQVGDTEQLVATVSPAEATNPALDWSSDNPSAATVSVSGLVSAVASGTATITVTTEDGGYTDTCVVTVETPIPTELPPADFTGVPDGTPLADFGYTVDNDGGGTPAFEIRSGVIESDTADLAGWYSFTTPQFEIDRAEAGGVIAEWDVRYPETVAVGDHERAKFYLRLTDPEGNSLYRFLFKPYLSAAQGAFNLELAAGASETSLQQVRSRDIDPSFTPTGAAAPWINFKLKILATGEIKLLINDVEFMSTTDCAYSLFSRVKFTYRTEAGAKNYIIQVRNLAVLPLE